MGALVNQEIVQAVAVKGLKQFWRNRTEYDEC